MCDEQLYSIMNCCIRDTARLFRLAGRRLSPTKWNSKKSIKRSRHKGTLTTDSSPHTHTHTKIDEDERKTCFQHFGGHGWHTTHQVWACDMYANTRCSRITDSLLFMVFKRPSHILFDFIHADNRKCTHTHIRTFMLYAGTFFIEHNVRFHAKSTNLLFVLFYGFVP